MSLKLVVFCGSARSSRLGIKVARLIQKQCEARGHLVTLIEPHSHPLPLLDRMYKEYAPLAGPFGGVRAAMTLRAMLGEMGTPSIPSTLPISQVHKAFADDGTALDSAYEKLADKFLTEFEWYAHALKQARETPCPRGVSAASKVSVA